MAVQNKQETTIPNIPSENSFNIKIEREKRDNNFDTYIETIANLIEEFDLDPQEVAGALNRKISENINKEAQKLNLVKNDGQSINRSSGIPSLLKR